MEPVPVEIFTGACVGATHPIAAGDHFTMLTTCVDAPSPEVPVSILSSGGWGNSSEGIDLEKSLEDEWPGDEYAFRGDVPSAFDGGGGFSLAIDTSGDLWSWGNDELEQLGNGSSHSSATRVKVLFPWTQ